MNKKKIKSWLIKYEITNYTINDDLTVDVHEDVVHLYNKNLTSLPFQFGIIKGNFNCSFNKLTSLEHCPKEVQGNFTCDASLRKDIRYLRYSLAKQLQAL